MINHNKIKQLLAHVYFGNQDNEIELECEYSQ